MTIQEQHSTATPTLRELCGRVPDALVPLVPRPAPDLPLTAVHISELIDPTPYLDGGELLLTTGLTLPRRPDACRRYVDRLVAAGLSGMALGLGPVHQHPPTALERACAAAGLPLLVVPDAVPFLAVTRGFWEAVGEEHERLLYAALDADRRIVAAATSTDPVPAVVRALAEAVHGWAVLLDVRGSPLQSWPPSGWPMRHASRRRSSDSGLRVPGPLPPSSMISTSWSTPSWPTATWSDTSLSCRVRRAALRHAGLSSLPSPFWAPRQCGGARPNQSMRCADPRLRT